jgi:hypothetical protein
MIKKLLLISIVILYGCNNQEKENIDFDSPSPPEVEEIFYLPNPEDCTGISIIWSAGETQNIFTKPEVIKQIPELYEGKVKLIGSKCKDCGNRVDGLFRYVSVKNLKLQGLAYEYSIDGSYTEQFFKDGLRHGTWLNYYKDGTVHTYLNYRNGYLHGEYEFFNETGSTLEKGCYSNDEYIGDQLQYYSNGNLKKLKKYDANGMILLIKDFREDGTLISKMTFQPKTDLVFYDVNGKEIPKPINVRDKIEINRD